MPAAKCCISELQCIVFLFQLAHEAFKKAQSLDPNYVSCWIGQVSRTVFYNTCTEVQGILLNT